MRTLSRLGVAAVGCVRRQGGGCRERSPRLLTTVEGLRSARLAALACARSMSNIRAYVLSVSIPLVDRNRLLAWRECFWGRCIVPRVVR